MKILLVYDYDSASYAAGKQMFRLRTLLREQGHDARLLTSSAFHHDNRTNIADYRVFGTTNDKLQTISQTFNLSAYWGMRQILREFQPDIVHVRMFLWQLSPSIMPLLRDYPAIYHQCVYKAICPVGTKMLPDGTPCHVSAGSVCLKHKCVTPQTWVFMMAQMKLFRRWKSAFDHYVAVGQLMSERMEAEGIGPATVLNNSITYRPRRETISETPLIVFAGRLDRTKGVDVLLRAMKRVHNKFPFAKLLIAGDGNFQRVLEKLTQDLQISDCVTFLGYVERNDMDSLFESAWIQVAPALWDEPFGNVILEAMMRGTVPIASDVGGYQELIQNGINGFLVPPNDVDALTEKICQILADRERLELMSQQAHHHVAHNFSESQFMKRILNLYEEVIDEFHA